MEEKIEKFESISAAKDKYFNKGLYAKIMAAFKAMVLVLEKKAEA